MAISTNTSIFICGALAVSCALSANAGGQAIVGAPCFRVFDALLFTGKPDLSAVGLEAAAVVEPDRWLLAGQSSDQIPDEASIQKGLPAGYAASAILVLDSENWPQSGKKDVVDASLNKFLTLLLRMRHVGFKGPIGYYGVPPNNDYWRAIDLPTSQPYLAWQSENNQLQPLADSVDVFLPSLYTFYDDQDGWKRYAIANLSEARRLARGKPIYAFIWPQFHNSNKTLGLKLIPGKFWELQLQTIAQYADGAVIWGGWRLPWNEQAEWWQVTRQFLRARPQTCSKPGPPRNMKVR
jgi:hypothetical protein